MPPGESWLSFIPGFHALGAWIESHGNSWLFGNPVHVQHIFSIILVAVVMALLSLTASRQLSAAGSDILPETRLSARTIVELLFEGLLTIMQFAMPFEAAMKHFRFIGTFFFFILFSNLLGLIPGFVPPTESFNTTFALSSVVFVYYNAYALYKLGFAHLSHMANPVGEWWGWFLAPIFFPIELVSHCIRPVSLAVRLMCNISGDHIVMGVFLGIFPFVLPMPFLGLGTFVALVQTFVFTLLSSVYIGEVEAMIAAHAHDHGHAHDHAHADAHEPSASHGLAR